MYSTCLFCNRSLGENEAIEHFRVGRRLAFDSAQGRLWVICRRCERWNLSPLEIRWEAIEECERRFHDTRVRVSTENIGLARLPEGLELVRVGKPLRPEFAAWRYGDQFGRRRRRAIAYTTAGATAGGLLIAGGVAAGVSMGGGWWMIGHLIEQWRNERTVARLRDEYGAPIRVQYKHLGTSRLLETDAGPGWALQLEHAEGWGRGRSRRSELLVLQGDEAVQVAGQLMARVNRAGGRKRTVQAAVRRIEQAGHPEAYLKQAAREADYLRAHGGVPRRRRYVKEPGSLRQLPSESRLALEMATQEQAEREALEGELMALEAAWRHAEEIAHIADNLLVPSETETFVRQEREHPGAAAILPGPRP
ncbi:MAG: hypothetical protein ACE5HQ_03975 [Gemmatimonadota bacterium]